MSDLYAIVLAAGKGTRMKSDLPKVLHQIGGKPMLGHIIESIEDLNPKKIIAVVGYKADLIRETIGKSIVYAEQREQLGTGHAVLQVGPLLKGKHGTTLVINGDTPLLTNKTLLELVEGHHATKAAATVLTMDVPFPKGYGRIVKNDKGEVIKIVEEKDATSSEKNIREVNTGIYCFDNKKLFSAMLKINNNNKQNEYYLTDVIEVLQSQGEFVSSMQTYDPEETMGINDRVALAKAEKTLRYRTLNRIMQDGVTIIDPDQTYIEPTVKIGQDTIIYPGCHIYGDTIIGENCILGPNTEIINTEIANNVTIKQSVITSSKIEKDSTIGPFAYIRPNSNIGPSVKIGDFVEIKNSTIGKGTKVPHLSYIGDADLGENINIGCGTITVNYDGQKKHRTIIEDRAFIGCNSNLVAPVEVGRDAYIAAGSTITDDVPDFTLSIARQRQINKENYVKKFKEKDKKRTD